MWRSTAHSGAFGETKQRSTVLVQHNIYLLQNSDDSRVLSNSSNHLCAQQSESKSISKPQNIRRKNDDRSAHNGLVMYERDDEYCKIECTFLHDFSGLNFLRNALWNAISTHSRWELPRRSRRWMMICRLSGTWRGGGKHNPEKKPQQRAIILSYARRNERKSTRRIAYSAIYTPNWDASRPSAFKNRFTLRTPRSPLRASSRILSLMDGTVDWIVSQGKF